MTKKTGQWEPVRPGERSFVHIVRWPGENLAIISLWYTGSEKNEEKLAENNPNINPGKLIIGDRIFIPNNMLIRREPMTEGFAAQSPQYLQKPEETKKAEAEPAMEPEKVEKKEPEPVAKPGKAQKTETAPAGKAREKKIQTSEPKQSPEEEDEPALFGPK